MGWTRLRGWRRAGNRLDAHGHYEVVEEPTDRELWDQAAPGSDAAFGALFERHSSAVYNYCFRRLGEWAGAEDLMAATFLEAWRRRDEVRLIRDSLRPWLLGVATNLMRNDRRSKRRREAAIQRLTTDTLEHGFADDVAARIDDERRMAELLGLLGRMTTGEQDVIALVIWSELTYEEAAVALRVPVGTVKSRLSRARRRLVELERDSGHKQGEERALARASEKQPREAEG